MPEPEVLAQRGAGVIVSESAAFLEQGDDLVGEAVQSAGGDVGDQNESVARAALNVRIERVGDGGRRPDESLALGHLDHQPADRKPPGVGALTPLRGDRNGVA